MLVLVMLLQTVPLDPNGSSRPLPRLPDLGGTECTIDGCGPVPERRYRLESERVVGEDTMQRAMRGVWQACETTGAPVCPSKGRLLFRTAIHPD